jgi:1,4-alpha-glucan branching enzyme
VRWTILDAHGLEHATPTPPTRSFAPIKPPDSNVSFFARDQALSEQIWSSKTGYPGDPWYREFHRDLANDRDDLGALTIPPHSPPTGIKLCRVTGGPKKEYYEREPALERARTHAADFVKKVHARIEFAQMAHVESPVIVCPFDFELFGHWWFEGPEFLSYLLGTPQTFAWATPSDCARNPFVATPSESSWGEGGYHRRWLNPETAWMYPLLHRAGTELDLRLEKDSQVHENALKNLLLAQASDWAFLQRTGNSEFGRKAFYWYVQQATSPRPSPVDQFLPGMLLSPLFRG